MIAFLRKRFVWALFAGVAGYLRRRYRRWKAKRDQLPTVASTGYQPLGPVESAPETLPRAATNPGTSLEPDAERK